MTAKAKKVRVLFKDPTIQKEGVSCAVRFVSIPLLGKEPKRVAAKRMHAFLSKSLPDVHVSQYDFVEPYENCFALVWPTRPCPVCMLIPDWIVSRPYLLDRVRLLAEGRLRDYGSKRKVVLPSGVSVAVGSYDGKIYREMNLAYDFAEGKPGVCGFHTVNAYVSHDVGDPELLLVSVPRYYVDRRAFGSANDRFVFSRPVPFTVFHCGKRIENPVTGETELWSPHQPDEAVFLNDGRGWIG